MRIRSVKPLPVIALATMASLACGTLAHAASTAATFPAQLHFVVVPNGGDKVWSSYPGVTFKKRGECKYVAAATTAPTWPPAGGVGGGFGTAPLFNPGFAKPDGTYDMSGHDDGFNVLFYPALPAAGTVAMVCRGTILADGKDVTLDAPGRVSITSNDNIIHHGPPSVRVQLDPAKMVAPGAFRPQLRFVVVPNGGDKVWSSYPNVTFQKHGECKYVAAVTTAPTWPPAGGMGGGNGTAPLFNPGLAKADGTYDMSGHDDGFNELFYTGQPPTATATAMVCRGTILANGKDVTLDAPGRVSITPNDNIIHHGPPSVRVQLDMAKLALVAKP